MNKDKRRQRKAVEIICVIFALLALGLFWVLQSAARYTSGSAYKMGKGVCRRIMQLAEDYDLPDSGIITRDTDIGKEIFGYITRENGLEPNADLRIICADGGAEYVLFRYRGSIADEDIRIYTPQEQIQSLSSYFTKGRTIFCLTGEEYRETLKEDTEEK